MVTPELRGCAGRSGMNGRENSDIYDAETRRTCGFKERVFHLLKGSGLFQIFAVYQHLELRNSRVLTPHPFRVHGCGEIVRDTDGTFLLIHMIKNLDFEKSGLFEQYVTDKMILVFETLFNGAPVR